MPDSSPAPESGCHAAVATAIAAAGGWLGFDEFLGIALAHPQHGYYGSGRVRLGEGGDFHTAPTLSPLFAKVLARLMLPYLADGGEVLELGAGEGSLAEQLLSILPPDACRRYLILETSAALVSRQQQRLRRFTQVEWLTTLPARHSGFIIANEVLDCVPFRLLVRQNSRWRERGVLLTDRALSFGVRDLNDTTADYLRDLPLPDGYETEFSPQAAALAATLAGCLQRGCLLFADYGYGRSEYYHPQRTSGTMLCYQRQRVDDNPLAAVGEKDITAHVDFTAIADAGLRGGCRLAGYVTQAQGLINSGITEVLSAYDSGSVAQIRASAGAHKLLAPHEMGEIIKWMGFVKGDVAAPLAFASGDISQRL